MKLSERIRNKWDDPELLVDWFHEVADDVGDLEEKLAIAEMRWRTQFRRNEQLEAENEWMRREVERVGHALYTGTKTGYVGTEEDLHAIGQTVEGVCETNLRLMNVEAYCDKLENQSLLIAENERLRFAAKQALMALEEGYDAPKIRQDLRDALKEGER